MKVLFATVPADGHFNPLTAVALDLQQNGHDVRWYAGPLYQSKLGTLGIPSVPYDRATEITGENIHDLYPE
ncbi:MAG: glycosyltransferase, partial [Chloroflexota bacterium]